MNAIETPQYPGKTCNARLGQSSIVAIMPPRKKQVQSVSGSSNETAIASFPVPPTMVPTKQDDGHRTPERSPAKKALGITQAQKQALMGNLQLESMRRLTSTPKDKLTDASRSHRKGAQAEGAVCATGTELAITLGDARQQNPASAEKTQHPRAYRRACDEEQPKACSTVDCSTKASRKRGATVGEEESEADKV